MSKCLMYIWMMMVIAYLSIITIVHCNAHEYMHTNKRESVHDYQSNHTTKPSSGIPDNYVVAGFRHRNHPGNVAFRRIIDDAADRFMERDQRGYDQIVEYVFQRLNETGLILVDRELHPIGKYRARRKILKNLYHRSPNFDDSIIEDTDIVCNLRFLNHTGNKKYQEIMNKHFGEYVKGRMTKGQNLLKLENDRIVAIVLNDIKSEGLTFVYYDTKLNTRTPLNKEQQRRMIIQRFQTMKRYIRESDQIIKRRAYDHNVSTTLAQSGADGEDVRDTDIVCDPRFNNHPGNKEYREISKKYDGEYVKSRKFKGHFLFNVVNDRIVANVLDDINRAGLTFVDYDPKLDKRIPLNNKQIRKKILQRYLRMKRVIPELDQINESRAHDHSDTTTDAQSDAEAANFLLSLKHSLNESHPSDDKRVRQNHL